MLLVHANMELSLPGSFVPKLSSAGFRSVVPDHFGFGKSDKPLIPTGTVLRGTQKC